MRLTNVRNLRPAEVVGRIWLQGPDGRVTETVHYGMPPMLRQPTLVINGAFYRQASERHDGTWVYQYVSQAPGVKCDLALTDFRTDQHPLWDGPKPVPPVATLEDVLQHFQAFCHAGRDHDVELAKLYDHFVAALQKQPYEKN